MILFLELQHFLEKNKVRLKGVHLHGGEIKGHSFSVEL